MQDLPKLNEQTPPSLYRPASRSKPGLVLGFLGVVVHEVGAALQLHLAELQAPAPDELHDLVPQGLGEAHALLEGHGPRRRRALPHAPPHFRRKLPRPPLLSPHEEPIVEHLRGGSKAALPEAVAALYTRISRASRAP